MFSSVSFRGWGFYYGLQKYYDGQGHTIPKECVQVSEQYDSLLKLI